MSFFRKKTKVFCVGQNKTGTTTVEAVLKSLGYKMGDQVKGEMLMSEWAVRDFKNIVNLCKTADAFQDIPFSNDFTYTVLDYAFPKSKFILTVRDNKDEWYESITRFHTKLVGKDRLPTADDLKEFNYRYKGFLWEAQQVKYGIDETTVYDYEIYTDQYEMHNHRVQEYFKHRPEDLLVLNLSEDNAMEKLYTFLGINYNGEDMPHLNASK
ncbi:MAG: sulfotransferase [Sulfurimonadaceae bacterium]